MKCQEDWEGGPKGVWSADSTQRGGSWVNKSHVKLELPFANANRLWSMSCRWIVDSIGKESLYMLHCSLCIWNFWMFSVRSGNFWEPKRCEELCWFLLMKWAICLGLKRPNNESGFKMEELWVFSVTCTWVCKIDVPVWLSTPAGSRSPRNTFLGKNGRHLPLMSGHLERPTCGARHTLLREGLC